MRKRLTKLSVFLIFFLLISTPFTAGATSHAIPASSDHPEAPYITLLEDLPIIVDDQEIGVLRAGAELYLHDSEGRKSIVLGTQEIILAEDIQYEEVENDGSSYIGYQDEEKYSSVTFEKETIFADSEFTKELAEITGSHTYPILTETEEYYEVIIGNVKGYIQKEVEAVEQFTADDVIVSNPELESEIVEDPESTTIKADQGSQSEASKVPVIQSINPNYFMITDESLSVYDNSTGKLVKVGALVSGQVYPKVQTEGNWIKIKYGNGYGYVWKESTVDGDPSSLKNVNAGLKSNGLKLTSNKYLSVYDNTSGKLVQFGTIQPNTEYPIISESGDWYKVDFAGRIGHVYKPAAQLVFTGKEKFFKVKTEFLSIYDNSSGSLKKVGSLIQNQEFPIVNISGNWIKIKYLGTEGYIWKDSAEPSSGSSIKNANKGLKTSSRKVVSNKYLSVYDNTSGSLVHFASIDPNVEYPIIESTGNWHIIDVSGRIGYIYKPATRYVFKAD